LNSSVVSKLRFAETWLACCGRIHLRECNLHR